MDITAWALVIDGKVVSIELQEPRWANASGLSLRQQLA
jgi:hypothetical protein